MTPTKGSDLTIKICEIFNIECKHILAMEILIKPNSVVELVVHRAIMEEESGLITEEIGKITNK